MLDMGIIETGITICINDHIPVACDKLKTLAGESMTDERKILKTVPNADLLTLAVMAGTILNLEKPLVTQKNKQYLL